jgi:uncharacterized membrane protein (UPF0182 family)
LSIREEIEKNRFEIVDAFFVLLFSASRAASKWPRVQFALKTSNFAVLGLDIGFFLGYFRLQLALFTFK